MYSDTDLTLVVACFQVGGNVRLMLCGSAPIRGNVITFMRATMGCVIVEG